MRQPYTRTRRSLLAAACAAMCGPTRLLAAEPLLAVQIGALGANPVAEVVQLGAGMHAMFAAVNARGGVHGRPVQLLQLDDGNDPGRFVQRFGEALRHKPLALLCPYGSPTVQRMLEARLLDDADLVVLNAVPGAEAFRNPGHPKLFHVRAGDGQQIDRIARHVAMLGIRRMGVLYVDAPGGHSGFQAASASARATGLQLHAEKARWEAAAISAAARGMSAANMQCALVIGPPRFTVDAIVQLRSASFSASIFSMSYLSPELLMQLAPRHAHGIAISQTYPNPTGVGLSIQREFQAAMKLSSPAVEHPTAFHLEGYLCARLFTDVARRLKEHHAGQFARTLRGLGPVDMGGFHVDFSAGNAGSRFVDIGIVNQAGRLVY